MVKYWLKLVRWQGRRLQAALRWGPANLNGMPAVLGNAMPKSGSHLIIQVLQGLTRIGPFVNPGFPPVNRSGTNAKLSMEAILVKLKRMRPGDIAYGYLAARQPYIDVLAQPNRATVFVFRDPRDVIISHVFYATEMHPGHGMHRYYTEVLENMEQRIDAAIQGVQELDSELRSVRTKFQAYLGWLEQPDVLCLRFEELILEREAALGRILDYLQERGFTPEVERERAIELLKDAIAPRKSGTFRKGQPGNWQEHFTQATKAHFKAIAGDLLIQLGYERDNDW
ncbi:MAG: sulfotransferase domain-containing protein [Anaerolineales bacterium]